MMRSAVVVGCVVMLLGAACRSDGGKDVEASARREDPSGKRHRGTVTVLEFTEHGPQLCSTVADSYPPQCGGPDVVGWNWDDVSDEESASGTTWGTYEVTGTWDGERLTLTEPPGQPQDRPLDDIDFTSPCPEPPDGWAITDPATATQDALDAATSAAQDRTDFAGLWLGESIAGSPVSDPTKQVLNVRVTDDVAAAEQDLREVWGGALCVSAAERTYAELRSIQEEIDAAGVTQGSAVSQVNGTVGVIVFVDDGLQAGYDEQYGPGVVVVTATLQPID